MVNTSRNRVVGISVAIAIVAVGLSALSSTAIGQRRAVTRIEPAAGSHYSVVMTEGHNLLVTDNAANKLFFYTIDKDKPIGSPLKLRASVDLTKVGEEEIRITPHNLEGAGTDK
jgi:hypothetical protein